MTWTRSKLTSLANFINGYAFKPIDWGEEGLPIIRIEQLRDPTKVEDFYSGRLPEYNIIDNGDLIFSWSASLFLRIWDDGRAALNQHLFKVLERKDISRIFLKYLIEYHLPGLARAAHGSTMQHITRKELNAFEVDYPTDIQEQERIAAILRSVDVAIDNVEALIAKQQRIKTGLMQDLLTKGIDEDGQVRSEETHEFKDSPVGRIPVAWDVMPIGGLAERITSGSRGWAKYYSDDGALFLRIGNLTREHINFRFDDIVFVRPPDGEEGSRTRVKAGDILISITADLGIIGVIPSNFGEAYINQHLASIRFASKDLSPRWAGHFMQGHAFQTQIFKANESGAKAGLNLPTVSRLFLAFPESPEEQEAIVKKLDHIDHSVSSNKRQLAKLQRLKTGLMRDLLSGNVPVVPAEPKQAAGATA